MTKGTAVGADIYILNTPTEFTLTFYNVSFAGALIFAQCSLYTNGSMVFRYDNSIPDPIPLSTSAPNAITIGVSSGRVRINDIGQKIYDAVPRVASITGILNAADDAYAADSILETYTSELSGSIAGLNLASLNEAEVELPHLDGS